MPLSVFVSFAELEDMKMKKKDETGTGELWKNNDFPICKTIVRLALYKQCQEPITGSLHLPYILVSTFARIFLFLELSYLFLEQ